MHSVIPSLAIRAILGSNGNAQEHLFSPGRALKDLRMGIWLIKKNLTWLSTYSERVHLLVTTGQPHIAQLWHFRRDEWTPPKPFSVLQAPTKPQDLLGILDGHTVKPPKVDLPGTEGFVNIWKNWTDQHTDQRYFSVNLHKEKTKM